MVAERLVCTETNNGFVNVRTGLPFEIIRMDRIHSANQCTRVLDAHEDISLREMEAHAHDEHGHEAKRREVSGPNHALSAEAQRYAHDEHDADFNRGLSR